MRTLITLFVAMIFLGSCCKRDNCTLDGTTVKIYGFNANELDSVKVSSYLKGITTGYTVDSVMYKATPSGDGYYTIPYRSFVSDRDYIIDIVQANRSYAITNIGMKEESCGSCNRKGSVYEELSYYYVNGNIARSSDVILRK